MKQTAYLALLLSLFLSVEFNAKIKLPAIVSSNMVLQRNTTVKIWGWSDPNETVSLSFSWIDKNMTTLADQNGNWSINIKTTNSKEPQKITINDKSSNITLKNILFGEVWLCSGQSNMEQPVRGFEGQPTYGSIEAIIHAKNTNIRLFTMKQVASKTPLNDVKEYIGWEEASPENVANFSAVGYFFGKKLHDILDVPVGLISSSWGASSLEAWTSIEVIKEVQEIDLKTIVINHKPNQKPTLLYNAMVYPIKDFKIKGVLWYQGETNRLAPEQYKLLFPKMVNDWRKTFGNQFPFYYVQIAPFIYYGKNDEFQTVDNSAFIREAQLDCLEKIPNSGIAVTLDIGDANFIHPPKKKEVAERLLLNALGKTYQMSSLNYSSPMYESMKVHEDRIHLFFKNAPDGLYSANLKGFEIAGEDKVFYPALAKITSSNRVTVSSDRVPNPVAVRYAWRNWVEASLYGANLLPVSSFRTDRWTYAKLHKAD